MIDTASNQKGFTLLETLGALVVTGIVLVTAIFFYQGMTDFYSASVEGRQAQSSARYGLSQIANRLHDSASVYRPNDANELRFSVFQNGTTSYRALRFNEGMLTLYTFNGTEAQWSSAAVSLASSPSLYARPVELARGLSTTAPPVYWTSASGTKTTLTGGAQLSNGETIGITLSYSLVRKTSSGGRFDSGLKSVSTSVKLYNDGL
ncbi:PilW family protein [Cohnella fermenti]|nr:type II secretion system protein [Cohnella fermenti]